MQGIALGCALAGSVLIPGVLKSHMVTSPFLIRDNAHKTPRNFILQSKTYSGPHEDDLVGVTFF